VWRQDDRPKERHGGLIHLYAQYRGARSCEQSDCDEVWIRADEQRRRQTEQMLVLAAHGQHITASNEWLERQDVSGHGVPDFLRITLLVEMDALLGAVVRRSRDSAGV
jgi:hypothetical protein